MLEMVFAIAIMGILSISLYNFDRYYNKSLAHIHMREEFNQIIETELSLAYSKELDYEEKTVETPRGNVLITFNEVEPKNSLTKSFELKFQMDKFNSSFIIERSKYHAK